MHIRQYLLPFFPLALPVFAAIGAFSEPACAQRAAAAPKIDRLYVDSDNGLLQGGARTFVAEGTPRGKTSVRSSRMDKNIALKEVSSGVYTGRYTIKRKEHCRHHGSGDPDGRQPRLMKGCRARE